MSKTRVILIAVTVEAETEGDLPSNYEVMCGINDGLPDEWHDMHDGDPYAIAYMTTDADWPLPVHPGTSQM